MKLSEYIQELTKFLAENGDMDVYSHSCEDNIDYYTKVDCSGDKMFLDPRHKERYITDRVHSEDDRNGYGVPLEDFIPVCVVN